MLTIGFNQSKIGLVDCGTMYINTIGVVPDYNSSPVAVSSESTTRNGVFLLEVFMGGKCEFKIGGVIYPVQDVTLHIDSNGVVMERRAVTNNSITVNVTPNQHDVERFEKMIRDLIEV